MSFGPEVAAGDPHRLRGDEDQTVAFLRDLAGDGPALELAIGTGRIARPLAATGVRVDGIDISQAMVDVLRAQPGGDTIAVTMGNFADVPVTGTYRLIYIVYNTIHNLLTQDDQVRCFQNVAKHLAHDGVFVVEAITHEALHLTDNQYVHAQSVEVKQVWLDVARYDPVTQLLEESHVSLTEKGVRLFPIVTRHIWPAEMDLMARIAGLRLRDRFGGWDRSPYTAHTRNIISVYQPHPGS
ncbi:MAG: methyltransferase domain-containing protein [Chloroflexi bacterium]|nr:methyltransferase domain-containing protein [Chloroflexota bacterium]